jgi:hypothetical protein
MSGPSLKAVEAAQRAESVAYAKHNPYPWREALTAAHDPALGLERSVCLRDVVEAMERRADEGGNLGWACALTAIFIEREFGQP